jgi:hypothetical protein
MSVIFSRAIRNSSGALIDAYSATIGVTRTDTDEVIAEAGTDMTRDSLGRYSYTISDPVAGVTYEATYSIQVRENGRTITSTSQKSADAPNFSAAQMVVLLRNALATNPVGVVNVTVDGQTVQYSRSQAIDELKFWQREAGKEGNTRPRTSRIRLDGF